MSQGKTFLNNIHLEYLHYLQVCGCQCVTTCVTARAAGTRRTAARWARPSPSTSRRPTSSSSSSCCCSSCSGCAWAWCTTWCGSCRRTRRTSSAAATRAWPASPAWSPCPGCPARPSHGPRASPTTQVVMMALSLLLHYNCVPCSDCHGCYVPAPPDGGFPFSSKF